MKSLLILLPGIFLSVVFSFLGIVLTSHQQLGSLVQTTEFLDEEGNPERGETLYPLKEWRNFGTGQAGVYCDGLRSLPHTASALQRLWR